MQSVSVSLLGHRAGREDKGFGVRGTMERQTMQKQHNGLNVFDSMEAQRTGLRVDPVSPSTSDNSVTAPPALAQASLCLDRNHVDDV